MSKIATWGYTQLEWITKLCVLSLRVPVFLPCRGFCVPLLCRQVPAVFVSQVGHWPCWWCIMVSRGARHHRVNARNRHSPTEKHDDFDLRRLQQIFATESSSFWDNSNGTFDCNIDQTSLSMIAWEPFLLKAGLIRWTCSTKSEEFRG